jgi:hypothetical protein
MRSSKETCATVALAKLYDLWELCTAIAAIFAFTVTITIVRGLGNALENTTCAISSDSSFQLWWLSAHSLLAFIFQENRTTSKKFKIDWMTYISVEITSFSLPDDLLPSQQNITNVDDILLYRISYARFAIDSLT